MLFIVLLQIIKVMLDDSEFESFVFCLAHKRVSSALLKDHADLVCLGFTFIDTNISNNIMFTVGL